MKVSRFISNKIGTNCYLVEEDGLGIVIDPCVNSKIVLKNFTGKLVGIFITHGHFDHFDELASFMDDNILIYMKKSGFEKLEDANKNCSNFFGRQITYNVPENQKVFLKDNDTISLSSNFKIEVIYSPGHSDCSLTYVVNDSLFTGDTLFKGSVGRTDLYSSNTAHLSDTLRKISKLKKDYIVYPGHDASTTLEDEIKNNIYMKRINL